MNLGPVSVWLLRTSIPPTHNTMIIIIVPRNSLIGWANCWRVLTRMMLSLYWLFTLSKRLFILSSAQKALMIRRPPKVSSTWLMVSLQRLCASILRALSFRPIKPINQPNTGTKIIVNNVSCHDITNNAMK